MTAGLLGILLYYVILYTVIIYLAIKTQQDPDIKRLTEEYLESNQLIYTGKDLLDRLLINGEYVTWYSNASKEQIAEACASGMSLCQEILKPYRHSYSFEEYQYGWTPLYTVSNVLSQRQYWCFTTAICKLFEGRYTDAFHELQDCIDDYNHGLERKISVHEAIAYSMLLEIFYTVLSKKDCEHNNCEKLTQIFPKAGTSSLFFTCPAPLCGYNTCPFSSKEDEEKYLSGVYDMQSDRCQCCAKMFWKSAYNRGEDMLSQSDYMKHIDEKISQIKQGHNETL